MRAKKIKEGAAGAGGGSGGVAGTVTAKGDGLTAAAAAAPEQLPAPPMGALGADVSAVQMSVLPTATQVQQMGVELAEAIAIGAADDDTATGDLALSIGV